MRLPSLLLSMLLLPAAAGLPGLAYAEPPPAFVVSDRTASDRADELVKQGLALGNQDRYADAEPLLREAWGLKRSYDIGANLGIVEAALSRWRGAAEHLTYALKLFPANGKPEHRKLLEDTLAKTLPHVATLTLKVNLDGAEVFVDGKSVGLSPLVDVVFVEPGDHSIEARRAGYLKSTRSIQAKPGTAPTIILELRDIASILVIPAAALAAGGLAAGIGLTVAANNKRAQADALRNQLTAGGSTCVGGTTATVAATCQSLQNDATSRDTLSRGAVAGYVLGGAFALAAAGLGWRAATPARDARGPKASARLVPLADCHTGGIFVVGAW